MECHGRLKTFLGVLVNKRCREMRDYSALLPLTVLTMSLHNFNRPPPTFGIAGVSISVRASPSAVAATHFDSHVDDTEIPPSAALKTPLDLEKLRRTQVP